MVNQCLLSKAHTLPDLLIHCIPDAKIQGSHSVVAVHGIHGNRGNAWGTDEANHQPGSNWLEQIHKDRPSSRIVTFGYDSRHFASGVYTTERFRDTALQLLDDLVELRRGSDLSAVRVPLILGLSVGVGQ